jgi:hypothetical protein
MALISLLALSVMSFGNSNSLAQDQEPVKKKRPMDVELIDRKAEVLIQDEAALGMMLDTIKVVLAIEDKEFVKGAPYSATAVTEMTQTLGDGNQIIRKSEAILYRDREGRTRREQTLLAVGNWTAAGNPPHGITINDPVAGVFYDLDPSANTARKVATAPNKLAVLTELDKVKMEQAKVATKMKEASGEQTVSVKVAGPNQARLEAEKKKESLGKQMIEGVMAEGRRFTLTIPAGAIGNTLPIEIVDEEWFSPELQMRVMTRHSDPRSGVTTYRLTNINRSDPDPSLFAVPAGYTIKDESWRPLKKRRLPEEEHR